MVPSAGGVIVRRNGKTWRFELDFGRFVNETRWFAPRRLVCETVHDREGRLHETRFISRGAHGGSLAK